MVAQVGLIAVFRQSTPRQGSFLRDGATAIPFPPLNGRCRSGYWVRKSKAKVLIPPICFARSYIGARSRPDGSTIGQPLYLLRSPSCAVQCGFVPSNAIETRFQIKRLPLNGMKFIGKAFSLGRAHNLKAAGSNPAPATKIY